MQESTGDETQGKFWCRVLWPSDLFVLVKTLLVLCRWLLPGQRNLRRTRVSRGVAQGAMNRSNTDAERFCNVGGLFGIGKDCNE
ncbi:MAG TPA: hypothetical protein VMU83_05890 [Hanamia sp.]|nr:hypothetical protein [Hanamia sp.]